MAWLGAAQQADGSFAVPSGGERAGHLATGWIAGFFALTPFARGASIERAGHWLAERFRPELVQSGDFAMIASHTHCFANAPHEAGDGILQWCGRELERGVRGGRLPALFALRVFTLCEAPVLPGTRIRARELLSPLAAEQASDGGWLPGLDDALRVEATLEALTAARRFPPPPSAPAGRAGAT